MTDSSSVPAATEAGGSDARTPPYRYTAQLANEIELAWQDRWDDSGVFRAPNPVGALSDGFDRIADRPKLYVLDMFPYPSGAGLHVGHPLGYIATDIFARFKRMTGHNVLHAMGYDAFGLPAEQYAVQTGTHPRITTEANIASMRAQLRRLGLGHDDRRSVATTDVSYYRWTQWIFLQIFGAWYDESRDMARPIATLVEQFRSGAREPRGPANPDSRPWSELDEITKRAIVDSHRLVYLSEQPVNWCPALGTVLANEEVTADGRSERGNHPVYRRPLKQWVMRITAFAERLLRDLELVNWPEPVKLMQRNWIGRSEGAHIQFPIAGRDVEPILVFTTRPDTVFGATYMVLAPEHPLVDAIVPAAWPGGTRDAWKGGAGEASPREAVASYREQASAKSDVQRQAENKEKTGVFTGAFAVNPASGERIPIFIADYVLMGYGTGAIMAVPAHDERDFEFARAFELPVRDVVSPAPMAAIAWFFEHVHEPHGFPIGWDFALADFVALATGAGYERAAFTSVLDTVRTRRRAGSDSASDPLVAAPDMDSPGGIGERRGVVRSAWIESLADILALGFDGASDLFRRGGLCELRGAAITESGVAVNSPPINGLHTHEAKGAITRWLTERGAGEHAVTFKLRDWLFSRQRYWGEPFPIVFDEHGLPVALPESMLPVELPELDDFQPEAMEDPSAPPRPPLGRATDWVGVELDLGDGRKHYRRELNTMPQWAGSCWYYLRYLDPGNDQRFCDPEVERYWMRGGGQSEQGGVDLYVGGVEHAVLHLLYARFWHKALFDLGHVSTVEPFNTLFNQGYIQAPAYRDARGVYVEAAEVAERNGDFFFREQRVAREFGKMGKSLKNSITPDEICEMFGADTLRLYEMYMGPLEQSKPWNPRDIIGMHRLLQKIWRNIIDEETGAPRVSNEPAPIETRRLLHRTIAGVRADCGRLQFNTAIAKLSEFNNHLTQATAGAGCPREAAEKLSLLIAPFAPHFADELWRRLGHDTPSVVLESFPDADESLLIDEEIEIVVQILGKVRGRVRVPADADDAAIERAALSDPGIARLIEGKAVRKVIVVPGRLINIVAQ